MASTNESTPSQDVIAAFDEALGILESALSAPYHPPSEGTAETDQAATILLHALSARDDARAVAVLAKAGLGYSLVTHVRTIFEARVKMIWLTKDAKRAIHFLESEPFERYWLASKYPRIKRRPVWKSVLAACAEAVKSNPTLLNHQTKSKKTSNRPDYLAIAKALRMPDIQELLRASDDREDAYTEDFLMNSLASHVSVVHLKDFPKGVNADGSMLLDTTSSRDFVDFYLLRAIPWILQIIAMASVALGTKDAIMPIVQEFNKRLDPIFERYNKS